MHYAVYVLATGALQSVGSVVADPLPEGLGVVELEDAPDLGAVEWDPVALAFVPRADDGYGLALTSDEFRTRYTFAERVAAKGIARTNDQVAVLMEDVASAPVIRLGHPRTVAGVQLLVSVGVLTEQRAAEILDPEWTPEDAP